MGGGERFYVAEFKDIRYRLHKLDLILTVIALPL